MKDEYDFSRGERGKFFNADANFNFPVYLEDEVMTFVEKIAQKREVEVSSVVNQLLRNDMHLAEVIR